MAFTKRFLLLFLIFVGAAAAGLVAVQRWELEAASRTVELTVEWSELKGLAAVLDTPMADLLAHFHSAGATSVALQEQTVRGLVDDGLVFKPDPFTDERVTRLIGEGDDTIRHTVLAFPDRELMDRVEDHLVERWGQDRVHEPNARFGGMWALVVDGDYAQFRDLGVGIDPLARDAVAAAGLGVVARVRNYPALKPETVGWIVTHLRASGAHAVIFTGEDVLGNPDLIHETAGYLKRTGLIYGSVEFGKQLGDEKLQAALAGHYVRVHTIQGAEFSAMTQDAAVARFEKAVRERNIRLLYVHLPSSVTGGTLDGDTGFIYRIRTGVRASGYPIGLARPMSDWSAPRWTGPMLILGVVAALALTMLEGFGVIPLWCGLGLGALLIGLVAAQTRVSLAIHTDQAGALLAALVFPTLSLLLLHLPTEGSGPDMDASGRLRGESHGAACVRATVLLLKTSLFSLLGALYIIGFLGSILFMTKTDQFMGIKPAIVLPILVIAVLYGGRVLDPGPWSVRKARLLTRLQNLSQQPLQVWHLVALGIALVVLGLLVARSGNDSAVGASLLELKTRRILDGWLIARPRTKELLVGHPALFLALYASARRWRRWVFPLLVAGAIGQTSLVNTFCHIHTPLYISLFHAINGLWLGLLLSLALAWLWDRLEGRSPDVRGKNGRRGTRIGEIGRGSVELLE